MIYDEWGGFFDHVRPPSVPDDRASADLSEDFGQLGFRSRRWRSRRTPAGKRRRGGGVTAVRHGRYAHESILSFISYRFGLGFLNKRHKHAHNIGLRSTGARRTSSRPGCPTRR